MNPQFFVAGLLAASVSSLSAAIVVDEPFDYGAVGGDLSGKNGGAGFSGAWSGDTRRQFDPAGLSLGSLSVSGGATTMGPGASARFRANRPFSTTLGGTLYGGFLFRINSRGNDFTTASLLLGEEGDTDIGATLAVNAPDYGSDNGRVRVEGSFIEDFPGDPLSLGTTYLALFKFDSAAKSATSWFLTADQYDFFAAGGLNESSLNLAATGSSSDNVTERGTTSSVGTLGAMTHLILHDYFDVSVTFDEIRISDTSIAEAAVQAVPEASTTAAMLAVGAAGVMAWRRQRSNGQTVPAAV